MRRPFGHLVAGLSVAVLAFGLAACGGSSAAGGQGGAGSTVGIDLAGILNAGAGADLTAAEGWPAGAPADVPPFPGKLTSLMPQRAQDRAGLFRARMFFEGVSRQQFGAYLAKLRSLGYALKGEVYYSEGESREDADRRAREGDVDHVTATKAPRVLGITAPGGSKGEVTYDLGGLNAAEADAVWAVTWPAAWAAKVPAPAWCTELSLVPMTNGTLDAHCKLPGADQAASQAKVDEYVAQLLSKGFKETGARPADGARKFNDGTYYVSLEFNPNGLRIKARQGPDPWDNPGGNGVPTIPPVELPTPAGGTRPPTDVWPAEWAAKVPAPDGCAIAGVSSSGGMASLHCTYPDPASQASVVAGYKAKLVAAGFKVETEVKVGETISMLSLSQGTVHVSVMASAPDAMTIMLTDPS